MIYHNWETGLRSTLVLHLFIDLCWLLCIFSSFCVLFHFGDERRIRRLWMFVLGLLGVFSSALVLICFQWPITPLFSSLRSSREAPALRRICVLFLFGDERRIRRLWMFVLGLTGAFSSVLGLVCFQWSFAPLLSSLRSSRWTRGWEMVTRRVVLEVVVWCVGWEMSHGRQLATPTVTDSWMVPEGWVHSV